MTQQTRILTALRQAGSRGISRNDFEAPNGEPVIDGGARILRVAGRIGELREQGYRIVRGPDRQGVAVYVLVGYEPVEQGARLDVAQATAYSLSFTIDTVEGGTPVTLRVLHPGWHLTDDGRYEFTDPAREQAA